MRTILCLLLCSLCLFGQPQPNTPEATLVITASLANQSYPAEWHPGAWGSALLCGGYAPHGVNGTQYLAPPGGCTPWSTLIPDSPAPMCTPWAGCVYPTLWLWLNGIGATGGYGEIWASWGARIEPGYPSVGGYWGLDLIEQGKIAEILYDGSGAIGAWSFPFHMMPGPIPILTLQGYCTDPTSPHGVTLTGAGEIYR